MELEPALLGRLFDVGERPGGDMFITRRDAYPWDEFAAKGPSQIARGIGGLLGGRGAVRIAVRRWSLIANNRGVKRTVKVRRERHYRPHIEFHHAVGVHLSHVEAKHEGWYYSLLSAFLLSAFTIEAYLNYVGPLVEKGWDDFDKASPLAKLRHVACTIGLELDSSRRPMQSVIELFTFRNNMAHPRTAQIIEETLHTAEDYQLSLYTEPRPKWMAFATPKNAQRCYDDVRTLIEAINAKVPKPDSFPLNDISWSGSAGPVNT